MLKARMLGNQPNWRRNKLVRVFQNYHSAIRARSKEGRHYTMRALYGVLTFEGMRVDKLGPAKGIPFCNDTGEGWCGSSQAFPSCLVLYLAP
jgi:hypothetical protein